METFLGILLVAGIYIGIPVVIALVIIGAVVLRQRMRKAAKASEVGELEKEVAEVGKWATIK